MHYAQLILPDFALILCGYLVCRFTALNRTVWAQVESLVYFFLFPVLLFNSIVSRPIDLGASLGFISAAVALVFFAVLLSYAVGLIPSIGKRDHAAAAQIAFRFNSFIALTLSERLGGAPALQLMAVLIGVCVPICNLAAVYPMAKGTGAPLGRALLSNPLIVATGGGLLANLVGFQIPEFAQSTVNRVGAASLALGLMACGAGMQLSQMRNSPRLSAAVLGIRHLLLPLLGAALVVAFGLGTLQATILLVFASMPTASSCYVLAARMGYNGGYIGALVTLSTLLGMVSLPLTLGVLLPLLKT